MPNTAQTAKARLLRRRSALVRVHEANREEQNELLETIETDWPDRAAVRTESDITYGLIERERAEIQEIDAALQRIAQGDYGRCEACGGGIGRQRLFALPEARRCAGCAEARVAQ